MLPPEFGALSSYKKTRDHAWRQDENSSMHFTRQVERSTDQSSGGYSVDAQRYCDDTSLMKFAIDLSLGLDVPSSSFSSPFQYEPLLAEVAPVDVSEHQIELPSSSSLGWCSRSEESASALEIQSVNAAAFERTDALPANHPPTLLVTDDDQTIQNDHSPSELAPIRISSEQLKQSTSNIPNHITPSSAGIDRRLTTTRPKPVEDISQDVSISGNPSKTNPSGKRKFTCDICDKSFPKSYSLARHKQIHSRKKKFECDICHESFRESYLLAKHTTIHTGQKLFTCHLCNKTFIRSDSLARHTTRHTGEKTFACRVCDKKFARKDALKSHVKTHPVEKNPVPRQDSSTASVDFGEQQRTCIDASSDVYVAYPTLVPSPGVILVKVNIENVFESTR